MRTTRATFHRMWLTTWRAYPWTFFFATVVAGTLTILLAYFAYHTLANGRVGPTFTKHAGTSDYVSFVALGAITYAFFCRVFLWTARAPITEEREGTLVALNVSPAKIREYLLGHAAFAVISTSVEALSLVAVAGLLGIRLPSFSILVALAAFLLFGLAAFSLALVMSSVMLMANDTFITQNTVFMIVAFACGFSFPTSFLPDPVQLAAEGIPITSALRYLRDSLSLTNAPPQFSDMAIALATSTVLLVLARATLPRATARAIERGM